MPLDDHAVPQIARHYRFQWEPAQEAHVLLYPEGMIKLPGSSGEIMKRVNGAATVGEIIADLEHAREGEIARYFEQEIRQEEDATPKAEDRR